MGLSLSNPTPVPACARIIKTPLREPMEMPIYEYICDDCGTKFEKLVRNGTAAACPDCGESHLTPTLSTFAAHSSSGKARVRRVPLLRRRDVSDAGDLRKELTA